MKSLPIVFIALFAQTAAHAACIVTKINNEKGVTLTQKVAKEVWSNYDAQKPNVVTMTDGSSVTFFIETIMTSPDTGIETITIQDQKAEACKAKFLYRTNDEGQNIYAGVSTTCAPDDKMTVEVACWF